MHAEGFLIVVAVALGLGAVQYVRVQFFPWRTCPRCRGAGLRTVQGPRRVAHADCKRCGATGRVRRWGARKEES